MGKFYSNVKDFNDIAIKPIISIYLRFKETGLWKKITKRILNSCS
jgi:hypothetical protein